MAENVLADAARQDGIARAIIGEPVTAGAFWVFFFQGRDYLENDDLDAMLTGNAPIVVPSSGGEPFTLSLAEDIDAQVAELSTRDVSERRGSTQNGGGSSAET